MLAEKITKNVIQYRAEVKGVKDIMAVVEAAKRKGGSVKVPPHIDVYFYLESGEDASRAVDFMEIVPSRVKVDRII